VTLSDELRALEVSLLQPAARYSVADLKRLLSEDFREFGSSGTVYDRAALIDLLLQESQSPFVPVEVSDFAVRELGPDAALVTYRTQRGAAARLRSSIWRREVSGWRMIFHQGTPTS
jgi:hypothetical protein